MLRSEEGGVIPGAESEQAEVSAAPTADSPWSMPLHCERLSGPEAFEHLAPEWQALEAQVLPRTPYTSPLWNMLWWKHFSENRRLVRDEFFAYAVRDQRGRLVAVAPMMLTHRPAGGPIQFRQLQFFGADPNITEIRGPVCRRQDSDAVQEALAHAVLARGGEWDWLLWQGLSIRADSHCFLERAGLLDQVTTSANYLLSLPRTWEAFKSTLSRNAKEALRKCYNSLSREGHRFEFSVVQRPEDVSAALELFFTLHRARANMEDAVVHRDVFRTASCRAFLLEYAQRMAERGQLRVFQLRVGGKLLATRIGFVFGDELYLYYSGFDPAWARYSIMTTALAETIRWAIGCGFSAMNLSIGNDASKSRWKPAEILFGSGIQRSPRAPSGVALRLYTALSRFNRRRPKLDWTFSGQRR